MWSVFQLQWIVKDVTETVYVLVHAVRLPTFSGDQQLNMISIFVVSMYLSNHSTESRPAHADYGNNKVISIIIITSCDTDTTIWQCRCVRSCRWSSNTFNWSISTFAAFPHVFLTWTVHVDIADANLSRSFLRIVDAHQSLSAVEHRGQTLVHSFIFYHQLPI